MGFRAYWRRKSKSCGGRPPVSLEVRQLIRAMSLANPLAATVDTRHIKGHYYQSHRIINPTGIVPVGPMIDLTLPHGRG